MQHKAVYLLFCKFTLHVSGVNHTHHQEYTKLKLQPPVLVIFFCAATSLQRGQAPSSGVHKTVTTASSTGHIFLCSYLPPTWPSSIIRSTQNCNYSLQYWSIFLCSYLPPTWPSSSLATLEGSSCSTGGCSYSFVYS